MAIELKAKRDICKETKTNKKTTKNCKESKTQLAKSIKISVFKHPACVLEQQQHQTRHRLNILV